MPYHPLVKSLFLTRDQTLSLLSGSADSKTLDYWRTSPRDYQIVRTHTKETTWRPGITQPPVATNRTKIKDQSPVDRRTTSLSLAHQRKNKQELSTNVTLYEAHTNHWTNLRRAETKRKKKFNFPWSLGKGDLKYNNLKKKHKQKRQRNTAQMKEQTRNTEVQINEEEIGKLPEKEFRIVIVKWSKTLKRKWRKCKNQLTKT